MRAGRLVSVLLLLQTRGRLTAREIADELEVSVRTVYRDLESLAEAGVPVVADRGATGGYRLLAGYRTRLTGLTSGEADSLFLAGMPAAAAELGLGTMLAAAELKLLAALPEQLRERAGRVRERFHLDAPGWFRGTEDTPLLAEVADAVWEQRRIRVTYRRWRAPREITRCLDPLGVVLKSGTWYLVAGAAGAARPDEPPGGLTGDPDGDPTDEATRGPNGEGEGEQPGGQADPAAGGSAGSSAAQQTDRGTRPPTGEGEGEQPGGQADPAAGGSAGRQPKGLAGTARIWTDPDSEAARLAPSKTASAIPSAVRPPATQDALLRVYRVAKILDLAVTAETFDRPDHFDLADYWARWTTRYESEVYRERATVRLSPTGVTMAPFQLAPAVARAVRETSTAPEADGWVRAVVPIESVRHAARDLLVLGPDLEVLDPPELRAAMTRTAGALTALYDPKAPAADKGDGPSA